MLDRSLPSASAAARTGRCVPSGGVPCDARLHQLPDERSREGMVRLKTNRALPGLEVLELALVGFDDGARVERAMIRGCAKPDEHSSIETEGGELIADALLSS